MVTHGLLGGGADPDQIADRIFVDVAAKVCVPGLFGFVMAALTAALMSTVDTLINAVSAVTVNDIYKPFIKRSASDGHYLKVARIVSLAAAGVGIALVPVFASFESIYLAHGTFTATVTPPMVVAIVLGAFWKRYTPRAAFWTLAGGVIAMAAAVVFPVLITPVAHGVAPEGGFKYMRALYGICVCLAIGISVSLRDKSGKRSSVDGLVVGSLRRARELFKGGPLNEKPWRPAKGLLEPNEAIEGVALSAGMLERLAAEPGDLVYVADGRAWLGGLRSVHGKISGVHEREGVIEVSPSLIEKGGLLVGRLHKVEKIF